MSIAVSTTSAVHNPSNSVFPGFHDDVLIAIFKYVMGGVTTTLPVRKTEERWSLSHVCHRWRALVVQTPELWTSFRFIPRVTNFPQRLKEMTGKLLERSNGRSINLDFDSRDLGVEATAAENRFPSAKQLLYGQGEIDIISSILLVFASQIRSIKWTITTENVIKSFLFIHPGTFPLLETVELAFFNDLPFGPQNTPFTVDELEKITVFLNLPRLRRAALCIANGLSALSLALPLGNMTMLNLGSVPMAADIFMEIVFQGAPSLLDGFFNVKFTLSPHNSNPIPIYIRRACGSNIKRLRLSLTEPSNDLRMFSLLTLPVLQEPKIEYDDPKNGFKVSTLANMLTESSTTLKILSLKKHMPPAGKRRVHKAAGRLCKALPNLVALHLSLGFYLPEAAMDQFSDGTLLPHLKFLRLSCPDGFSVLRAVQRRNEHFYRPMTSTTQLAFQFLLALVLGVSVKQKSDVEAEYIQLKGDTALGLTEIDILGENTSLSVTAVLS